MRAVTCALLSECAMTPGQVVDLGCGGGRLLDELAYDWPNRLMHGLDIDGLLLSYAAVTVDKRVNLVQADLRYAPYRDGACAVCLALDAFDQKSVELDRALAECRRILQPGGCLLMRVSAYPWLAGPHDAAFHTGRRYTKRQVTDALEDAGFELVRVTYANTLLAVPAGLLRLLQRWSLAPMFPAMYMARSLNRLLAGALMAEAVWLRRKNLAGGMSLYAVARKP